MHLSVTTVRVKVTHEYRLYTSVYSAAFLFPGGGSLISAALLRCSRISGNGRVISRCRLVGFLFFMCVCRSHNIISARRHAESGHEVMDRCELLSVAAGGCRLPAAAGESRSEASCHLILYVWLLLNTEPRKLRRVIAIQCHAGLVL